MDVNFTLQPEAVGTIAVDSKQAVLQTLADRFAGVYGLNAGEVLEGIEERERLGSTGFGRGVAIPHARISGLQRPVSVFLRLDVPVDFNAADGLPVDVVFGLLSPEAAGATHLQALASISRLMRDEAMHQAIVRAPGAEAIFGLLSNVVDRDAA